MAGQKCAKDRTGQKYYFLLFKTPTNKRDKQGAVIWELQCDCGNITYASGKDVISGNTKSCGCFANRKSSELGKRNRKFNPIISSARIVWGQHYRECDFDTFFKLSQKECFYCGRAPQKRYCYGKKQSGEFSVKVNGKRKCSDDQTSEGCFLYNGLDRIDNSKGHSPDNVVTSCYRCNQAKNDMTFEEFIKLIALIYKRWAPK